ncbi:ROS/MUCR transcriptional regulator domain protein [Salmonella enterica subsp. enterica]|nr:ROS/MUCR transcriptional regulator domain protein [Salmonella enterica subsp. enterica serovar Tennessee]EGX5274995.1 ROS/MUCR transcriptional regulator domain protein [Salmonella enterica]EIT6888475.1 MucR family transcriptional regulator [Salmonella enterica subsp. enterica serovar Newport]
MADKEELTEKIQCLECGKYFSFLAPHQNKPHQMNARDYRERWGVPLHPPLASVSHSRQCRENVLSRIRRGEINPDEQLALKAEAVKRMEARKVTGEKVKAIAADLNLSVGCLYKWVSATKRGATLNGAKTHVKQFLIIKADLKMAVMGINI